MDNTCITNGQPWTVPGLGMKFVYVAPGSFLMMADGGKPAYNVTISKEYWIGKYDVTQDEYQYIMGKNPSSSKGNKKPVELVSWYDAMSFCQLLTERERVAGRLLSGYEYRLPTEAEWEFAARGGIASKGYKYSGGDDLGSVAWNDLDMTYDVGMKAPNELGIYDMSGNVWEWCLDDWDDNCYGPPADGSRQGDGTGENRVMRGGSGTEVTYRFLNWPDESDLDVGFRVVYAVCSK